MALTSSIASQLAAFSAPTLHSVTQNAGQQARSNVLVVKASHSESSTSANANAVSRRQLAVGLGAFGASLASWTFAEKSWALLDDDDDEELLQRVKRERKERKESLKPGEEALQGAVSDLRAVGKALDSGDLASASKAAADVAAAAVAGGTVEEAIKTLKGGSGSSAAGSLRTGIADLQAALTEKDILSAKKAFVASATALQELSSISGLASSITGL